MKYYTGIKEAHEAFNFPGSYRTGTIIKKGIVVRIYSNSHSKPDRFTKSGSFYYFLKNDTIRAAFRETRKQKLKIHVFTRNLELNTDEYHGEMLVSGFSGNYVLLRNLIIKN
jgi:hypothetical protein